MAHSLIFGMTESGKTSLAKQMIKEYKARDIPTLVLDPMNDPSWGADFVTDDPDEFLTVFWDNTSCAVFIDEAGDSVGKYNKAMEQTATKGRHWGHSCHYLTQRGAQLSRTIRDQCQHLYLFTTSLNDCKVHADEWNNQELREASKLKQGEYYHTTRFGELTKNKLF